MKKIKWNKELVQQEALKYKTRGEFMRNSPSPYAYALSNNLIDIVCSHMTLLRKNKRTIEEIKEIALKYNIKKNFQKNENGAYLYASRRGWLDYVCAHMEKQNKYWKNRKDEVHQEALKYNYRGEFCLKSEYYYEIARRHKWLDDVCSHMKPVGHKYKRLVYVYKFPDNVFYVGLTGNKEKRNWSHLNINDSPVFKYIEKTKFNPEYEIVSDGYINSEEAQKLEEKTLELYIKNGWKSLNKHKAGGLGGTDKFWTEEKLIEIGKKYKYKSDFRKKERKAWDATCRKKLINEVCSHMIDQTSVPWTIETIKNEIKKYETLKDFRKNSAGAYGVVLRNNWFDEVGIKKLYNHNKKWDCKESILKEISKYKTLNDFRKKSPGAFKSARKKGWLRELTSNLEKRFIWTEEKVLELAKDYSEYSEFYKNHRIACEVGHENGWINLNKRKKWDYESVKQEASKYEKRNDFCVNSPSAYQYALKNNLLDDITKHMKLMNVKGTKRKKFICSECFKEIGGIGNIKRHMKVSHNIDY